MGSRFDAYLQFLAVGREQVGVDVTSVIRASPTSFRVAWVERRYRDGSLAETSRWTAILTIVIQTPAYARLTRTATLSLKNSEYIQAIESLGASRIRIIFVHILPNVVGPLLIVASMDIPSVVTLEAGLTYLGMGIPPPAASWGRTLQEGYSLLRVAPWIVIAGGIPLIITTVGFTFFGESLRDNLDPKLRRLV